MLQWTIPSVPYLTLDAVSPAVTLHVSDQSFFVLTVRGLDKCNVSAVKNPAIGMPLSSYISQRQAKKWSSCALTVQH